MKQIIFRASKINNDENENLLKIHYPVTKIDSELWGILVWEGNVHPL